MKSAGKARSNGLYRHIRTSKEIIRNLLNDLNNPYGNIITSTFTAWFGEKFYILGFLPAIALALVLMYAPWVVEKRKRI